MSPLVKILEQGGLGIGTRNGRRKGRSRHPSQSWCAPRPLPSGYLGGDARARGVQTAEMAPLARLWLFWGRLDSFPATPGWGTVVFVWLFLSPLCTAPASAIQVTVSDPYHVVILFQPVTLPCTYQSTTTPTAPIVIWKYKSFCRDRLADAFSPASVDNQLNAQLAAGNPGYNPYVECQDSVRTVRVVATKQGNAVTLGDYYQGRRITITGMYAAGKAATSGVPSIYAPSTYAHLSPAKTPLPPAMIPMGPLYNGYSGDFDRNSSVGGHSSQVPLLRDTDSNVTSEIRSGYRIQANQQDDSMRVLYYMEKELANFDSSRPGPPNGRVERAMSEVTSLHEDDWRSRPSRGPALTPIRDEEWGHHSPRSSRRWEQEPPLDRPGSGWGAGRPRARSVDALDDLARPGSAESGRSPPSSGRRGRACAPPRSRSRDDLYDQDQDDSRHFPHSRDPYYDDFRSRGRPHADPRARYHPSRDPPDDGSRSGDPQYDGQLLEEALRKKGPAERRRPYREEEEEAYYPPAPPPYSETDSQASRERRLKNLGLSRESLVV
ncbi:lipolysis-stimulated lipoprotein receptor isoform X4 [Mesoplodon densirostris]|uniref:lipolysis-stimulated lipoprotein receptor isoform X4 n=1 Tax=Mesoplodon densirostris TaxID=48708 RepID=UPI0028DC0B29|nr:lipolysis-stimulated lipoprotein receptor isoform X4 [Mesoplodon densirostris]